MFCMENSWKMYFNWHENKQ